MTGMLAQVQVGQKVIMHDLEHGFELAVAAGEQPGLTVIEILPNHIVMEDTTAGVISRMPVYLIKAVRTADSPAPVAPVETVEVETGVPAAAAVIAPAAEAA
jgi:hypothetical protein